MPRKPFVLGRKRKSVKKTVATKQYVKKQFKIAQELKYHGEFDSLTTVSNAGLLPICFTDITQGDTDLTRDGDAVNIKGVVIRGTLQASTVDLRNLIRCIVFQWYPIDTASTPSILNIIHQTGAYGIIAPYNHDLRNQYKILADRTFLVDQETNRYRRFQIKVPMKYMKKKIQYVGGDLYGSNHLFMLFISDSASGTNPTISYYTRVWFTDS